MSDIESLLYSYPVQGQPGFATILSTREEFWPTDYDLQRAAAEETVTAALGEEAPVGSLPPTDRESPAVAAEMTDENISRHAVRVLVERFMLIYDRLFLYYSTGSGKTVISTEATEGLVRHIATELVDSYLEPSRTNLRRVIVIVSSDAQKRDFMRKIVETSRRPQYENAVRIGSKQSILDRMATYLAVLTPTYVFHTKTSFLATVYGAGYSRLEIDPTKPDPGGLAFANNSVILIDEIHSFSREESGVSIDKSANRGGGSLDAEEEETTVTSKKPQDEEDLRYAQYHYVLHAIQGSKVIGLSATPMKDSPQEIAKVMNLILPLDRQIPADVDVLSRESLIPYLRGYVSYFRTRSTRVMNRGVMLPLHHIEGRDGGVVGGGDGDTTGEFEVLFPVAMSPLQAKVYKTVISERDAFNRNALRSSNIVYPEGNCREGEESCGSTGQMSFMSRYVHSMRGWDGMEPTDEFRGFLRESRDNRESLSPKFCTIVDICRVSRGVIFVYMRNLQGGLFDLAAFLDAEGYERFTPQSDTVISVSRADGTREITLSPRPRYSLVIGETKTIPGRLDGILELANSDENAGGDYLKIVLGSAAVRESFDIKNSVTMIIASPEQTETAMTQALGRIVRPGYQRALLRKFPDLPPIVSVYRMASYLPGTKFEGKDVDTYLESARKDRRIKVVERMLRDSSVDCRMLHNINYDELDDVVNDSPVCLYGPCDYTCDVESLPIDDSSSPRQHQGSSSTLDSSSMNALYRMEKLIRLQAQVTKAATRHMYIPITDIDAVVESHALAQRVIETMSVSKEQLKDRYGRQVYVYHDRNGVFFASSPVITGLVGDSSGAVSPVSMSDYEHYITTSLTSPLDILFGGVIMLPGTLEAILISISEKTITGSIAEDHNLIRKFSLYLRREIVSKSDLLEHVRVRGEQRIKGVKGHDVYWVDYSGLLYTRGDLRVYRGDEGIIPAVDKTSSGLPLRILPEPSSIPQGSVGKWESPSPVLMQILHHRWRGYMRALFAPYESRFPFYAVIRPSEPDVLRIASRGRDNAKTPGRALPSWSGDDLREVLATLIAGDPKNVTRRQRNEANETFDKLTSSRQVSEYLISEFERRGMLLRL